jgi:hypothetical protein
MPNSIRELIQKLQDVRESKALLYFLSDRRSTIRIPGINTVLAGEPHLIIYDHLRTIGHVPKLDLVIHTRGGNLDAVWPLVSICREMSEQFSVLVPMTAHSAGTLLCLGAEQVLMGTGASLSPIDPSTSNLFNPTDKHGNPKPISVEDVVSYFRLARDESKGTGIHDQQQILEIFKQLSNSVSPLALGNVNRVHTQIRLIAEKLLNLHPSKFKGKEHIDKIVKVLTEELYSHSHQIGITEAIDLFGDKFIQKPTEEVEQVMWDIFEWCATAFKLRGTFNVKEWIGTETQKTLDVVGAILVSENLSHAFTSKVVIRQLPELPPQAQIQIPPGQQMPLIPGLPTKINIEPIKEGWYTISEGENIWSNIP